MCCRWIYAAGLLFSHQKGCGSDKLSVVVCVVCCWWATAALLVAHLAGTNPRAYGWFVMLRVSFCVGFSGVAAFDNGF